MTSPISPRSTQMQLRPKTDSGSVEFCLQREEIDEMEFSLQPVNIVDENIVDEKSVVDKKGKEEKLYQLSVHTTKGDVYFYTAQDLDMNSSEFQEFTNQCRELTNRIVENYEKNHPEMTARLDIWNLQIVFKDANGNKEIQELFTGDHPEIQEFRDLLKEKRIIKGAFPDFYPGSRTEENLPQALDFTTYRPQNSLTEYGYKKSRISSLSRKKAGEIWKEMIFDEDLRESLLEKKDKIFKKMFFAEWILHQIKSSLLQEVNHLGDCIGLEENQKNKETIERQMQALNRAYNYIEGADGKPGDLSLYSIHLHIIADELEDKNKLKKHMENEMKRKSSIKGYINTVEKRFINETLEPILYPSRAWTRRHRQQLEKRNIAFERTANSFEEWIYQLVVKIEGPKIPEKEFEGFFKGLDKYLKRFGAQSLNEKQKQKLLEDCFFIRRTFSFFNSSFDMEKNSGEYGDFFGKLREKAQSLLSEEEPENTRLLSSFFNFLF